ncbi:hypothetical protein [Candidatus Rickettsia kedanie]|uniref:hypothetical protein n=1 Tax=Candidatus Rickettsia kedanie TaxID=3115352 RepID=UPI00399D4EA9
MFTAAIAAALVPILPTTLLFGAQFNTPLFGLAVVTALVKTTLMPTVKEEALLVRATLVELTLAPKVTGLGPMFTKATAVIVLVTLPPLIVTVSVFTVSVVIAPLRPFCSTNVPALAAKFTAPVIESPAITLVPLLILKFVALEENLK